MPTIDPPALRDYVERIFVATGSPAGDADAVATHLVEANLKGHDSHGVIRVQQYVDGAQAGRIKPGATTDTESETETTAVLNGNWNYGQVVARDTMAKAIEKAQASGVGIVVAHQAAHAGRIGAYGEQATRAGMIAIACVTVHGGGQLVAPFGGAARRLSTNPLVVAAPTNDPDAPFVLDMATSMGAEGKVRVARNRGAQLAPDWIARPARHRIRLRGAGARERPSTRGVVHAPRRARPPAGPAGSEAARGSRRPVWRPGAWERMWPNGIEQTAARGHDRRAAGHRGAGEGSPLV